MDTRLLLACREGVARKKYQEAVKNLGVQMDTVSSLKDLHSAMLKTPYNGVMIDLITKIKASQDEKSLIDTILEEFPVVQVHWEDEPGGIKSLFLGQFQSSGTLEDFLTRECRLFHARKIRASIRKKIHFNVILARDHHFHESSIERTITMNISEQGCFLFTVEEWGRGNRAWFIIHELEDHTPIQGKVRRRVEWGKSMNIPGIGIEFEEMEKSQFKEFCDKYYY
jgi:hypothetical protein